MSGRCLKSLVVAGLGLLTILAAQLPAQETDPPDDETATSPPERIIYVPYLKLEDVLDQQNSSVVIPYADYLKLWSKVEGAVGPAGTTVDAVITRADYTARIEEDVARIIAEFEIRVIGKPWVEVPLNFGEAAVGKVASSTGEVLLRGTGEGTYTLLLKNQGEQRVSLELTTRVVTSPDGRQIAFETPTVAVSTLELIIPQADQEVQVRPRLIQSPVDGEADSTHVKASLGATGQVSAAWHARASAKPQMELLANVTNLQRVRIADGLVHNDATLEYGILRGELKQVRIAVPRGQRVLDVTATARVQKWQTEEEVNRQVVTVDLLSPVTDKLTVEIHTEAKLTDEALAIAGIDESGQTNGIHALDVVRESGQLVVSHGDELTLRVADQSGLVRIDNDEVAAAIRQPGALAYKFFSPQFSLRVDASAVEPRVTLTQLAAVEIREEQLRQITRLSYVIERAGLFELQLTIPEGLEITRVDSDQMEDFRVDGNLLVISLRQRMTGEIGVTVTGEQDLPADGETFDLPLLEPLNVEREQGTVQLLAPDAVEVTTNEEDVESALPDALGAAGQGDSHLRASWRFTRRPVRIPVTVTRKPTRLSAQVSTDVDVQPTRTRMTTNVDFLVEYAGLDTFRFDVPEVAIPTLQIESVATDATSPALRETTTADPLDGWVTHTLTMQRPVIGRQRFRVTYDLKPSDVVPDDDGAIPAADAGGAVGADDAVPADASDQGTDDDTNDADSEAADSDSNSTDEASTDAVSNEEAAPTSDGDSEGTDDVTPPEAAAPNGETDDTADATDEGVPTDPDVPQMQTTIWIIRPLGVVGEEISEPTALTSVTGEVRLAKEESLTITAQADGADVEPIDVRELRLLPVQGTLAFRYRQHNVDQTIELAVTQARFDVQEMIATVVTRAVVEIMLGEDRTATYRCRYRIKSTERQRLPIRLPKGIVPLSVLVNGNEVRLEPVDVDSEQKRDTYFINVSRPGESDEPFSLTLQYLLSFDEPPFDAGFMRGRLDAPLPTIGAEDGSAATQELRTIVWVPADFALIGDPTGFVLDGYTSLKTSLLGGPKRIYSAHDDDNWIGGTADGGLDYPTAGRVDYRYTNLGGQSVIKLLWWDTVKVTIVASLALAVMALVLLRTDWENKLGILLLIVFGAVLLGLKNMHVLAHALSAMRFGLAFMVGLWLLHALFGARPHAAPAAMASPATGVTSATPPHAAAVPPPGVFDHFLKPKSDRDDDFS